MNTFIQLQGDPNKILINISEIVFIKEYMSFCEVKLKNSDVPLIVLDKLQVIQDKIDLSTK